MDQVGWLSCPGSSSNLGLNFLKIVTWKNISSQIVDKMVCLEDAMAMINSPRMFLVTDQNFKSLVYRESEIN